MWVDWSRQIRVVYDDRCAEYENHFQNKILFGFKEIAKDLFSKAFY